MPRRRNATATNSTPGTLDGAAEAEKVPPKSSRYRWSPLFVAIVCLDGLVALLLAIEYLHTIFTIVQIAWTVGPYAAFWADLVVLCLVNTWSLVSLEKLGHSDFEIMLGERFASRLNHNTSPPVALFVAMVMYPFMNLLWFVGCLRSLTYSYEDTSGPARGAVRMPGLLRQECPEATKHGHAEDILLQEYLELAARFTHDPAAQQNAHASECRVVYSFIFGVGQAPMLANVLRMVLIVACNVQQMVPQSGDSPWELWVKFCAGGLDLVIRLTLVFAPRSTPVAKEAEKFFDFWSFVSMTTFRWGKFLLDAIRDLSWTARFVTVSIGWFIGAVLPGLVIDESKHSPRPEPAGGTVDSKMFTLHVIGLTTILADFLNHGTVRNRPRMQRLEAFVEAGRNRQSFGLWCDPHPDMEDPTSKAMAMMSENMMRLRYIAYHITFAAEQVLLSVGRAYPVPDDERVPLFKSARHLRHATRQFSEPMSELRPIDRYHEFFPTDYLLTAHQIIVPRAMGPRAPGHGADMILEAKHPGHLEGMSILGVDPASLEPPSRKVVTKPLDLWWQGLIRPWIARSGKFGVVGKVSRSGLGAAVVVYQICVLIAIFMPTVYSAFSPFPRIIMIVIVGIISAAFFALLLAPLRHRIALRLDLAALDLPGELATDDYLARTMNAYMGPAASQVVLDAIDCPSEDDSEDGNEGDVLIPFDVIGEVAAFLGSNDHRFGLSTRGMTLAEAERLKQLPLT